MAEVVDVRYWVPIGNGDFVQVTIIYTRPPLSIRFLDHVKWARPRTFGWAADALVAHPLEFRFGSLEFIWCQTSGAAENGWSRCQDVVGGRMVYGNCFCWTGYGRILFENPMEFVGFIYGGNSRSFTPYGVHSSHQGRPLIDQASACQIDQQTVGFQEIGS